MEQIVILVPASTTFAKAAVDMFRMASPSAPGWSFPLLAVVVGIVSVFLLMLATGETLTQQMSAMAVLAGFLGAAAAVGVTELARASDDKRAEARRDA